MSLGGFALAIGVLVDAAIVMVENGYRQLSERPASGVEPDGEVNLSKTSAKSLERERVAILINANSTGASSFFMWADVRLHVAGTR